jgi:hypothetical protein
MEEDTENPSLPVTPSPRGTKKTRHYPSPSMRAHQARLALRSAATGIDDFEGLTFAVG